MLKVVGQNLVVLANYQEALRDARKMVWRDRGEPAAELHTLEECLRHAARGGLRKWTLHDRKKLYSYNLQVLAHLVSC